MGVGSWERLERRWLKPKRNLVRRARSVFGRRAPVQTKERKRKKTVVPDGGILLLVPDHPGTYQPSQPASLPAWPAQEVARQNACHTRVAKPYLASESTRRRLDVLGRYSQWWLACYGLGWDDAGVV